MNEWTILQDALLLLLGAMLLGALFERFKQNAVLGYLLAGALLGPHAFNALPNRDAILSIAELGSPFCCSPSGWSFRGANFGASARSLSEVEPSKFS